jgi:hypothetical protein
MSECVTSAPDAAPGDKWWTPIALLAALVPVLAALGILLPPDAYASLLVAPLALLGGALTLLSPAFVYLDRRYLRAVADWEPSGWFYWMVLPPLAPVLAAAYLYRRHERVGVP